MDKPLPKWAEELAFTSFPEYWEHNGEPRYTENDREIFIAGIRAALEHTAIPPSEDCIDSFVCCVHDREEE